MLRWLLLGVLCVAAPAYAAHGSRGSTTFRVQIENVSTPSTLKPSDGGMYPAPNSPGVWWVHTKNSPVFKTGKPDMGYGLEAQAEDGNPERLSKWLQTQVGKAIESTGVFTAPIGDSQPGPALPGKRYEFTITAAPGAKLSFTTMFGQSNDLFYAPAENGIPLFDRNGRPIRGDVTSQVLFWDAGTEVNEEPGVGKWQAPRQPAPNSGPDEHGVVRLVHDRFTYPKTAEVIRVTITPQTSTAQR